MILIRRNNYDSQGTEESTEERGENENQKTGT